MRFLISQPRRRSIVTLDKKSASAQSDTASGESVVGVGQPNSQMYDVFKFNILRQPKKSDPTLSVSLPSTQAVLEVSPGSGRIASGNPSATPADPFLSDPKTLNFFKEFEAFATSLPSSPTTLTTLESTIKTIYKKLPKDLIQDSKFVADKMALTDALLLIWTQPNGLPAGQPTNTALLMLFLRLTNIIERVGNGDQTLENVSALQEALQRTFVLTQQLKVPTIHPVGVMDLHVVKQVLIDYEPYHISYIQNVLKSESEKRATVYSQSSTQTTTTTQETTQVTTKDLQIDERFNLQKEVDYAVQNSASLQGSLSVSAAYGPTVNVNTNVNASTSTASQDSSKTATDYGKQVVTKASSQITQKVSRTRTAVVTEAFTETNEHGFDNTAGSTNISGIYQFVDEIYQARVFNYGKRLMFDLIIPEPAAFIIDAINPSKPKPVLVKKPADLTFIAYSLTDGKSDPANGQLNYLDAGKPYDTQGLKAPPDEFVTAGFTWSADSTGHGPPDDNTTKDTAITIPTGYQADHAVVTVDARAFHGHTNWSIHFLLGQNAAEFKDSGSSGLTDLPHAAGSALRFNLNNEIGSLPLTIRGDSALRFAVSVEVICKRTQSVFENWQNQTFDTIEAQYLSLLNNYNTAQAAVAAVSDGTQYRGSNPDENMRIMKTELKKVFLAMFMGETPGQEFASYSAITSASVNPPISPSPTPTTIGYFPEVDIPAALQHGKKIRFFEEAFEWENIQYVFYPYYWGRKPYWYDRLLQEDPDPTFAAFLRCGAARVAVPVRRFWEKAVRYYLDTHEVWNGADIPDITSPLYVDIAEEIKEIENGPTIDAPTPISDPWQFKLPTTQIYLRQDGRLPYWYQDPSTGNWTPGTWIQDTNGNWIHEWTEQLDGTWKRYAG